MLIGHLNPDGDCAALRLVYVSDTGLFISGLLLFLRQSSLGFLSESLELDSVARHFYVPWPIKYFKILCHAIYQILKYPTAWILSKGSQTLNFVMSEC